MNIDAVLVLSPVAQAQEGSEPFGSCVVLLRSFFSPFFIFLNFRFP